MYDISKLMNSAFRRGVLLAAAMSALTLVSPLARSADPTPSPGTVQQAASLDRVGQSVSLLPDGRWLVVGGQQGMQITGGVRLYNPVTRQWTTSKLSLQQARAHHTATVLPDGRVFVFGGVGADGLALRSAELLDLGREQVSFLDNPGLNATSHHSAQLLVNGNVLILDGVSGKGFAQGVAELWDPRTGAVSQVGRGPALERSSVAARMLANGDIVYAGGLGADGQKAGTALVYRAEREFFEEISVAQAAASVKEADAVAVPGVAVTIPAAEERGFAPGGQVAIRFNLPVDVRTVNTSSVVLFGPFGAVPAKVVPSQDGMLAFLTPVQDLFPATRYTLFIKGVSDTRGRRLTFDSIGFNTATLSPGSRSDGRGKNGSGGGVAVVTRLAGGVAAGGGGTPNTQVLQASDNRVEENDDDIFVPGADNTNGRWRTSRALPRVIEAERNLQLTQRGHDSFEHERKKDKDGREKVKADRFQKSSSQTGAGVSGMVLRLSDKPLRNVVVRIGERSAKSDDEGRFQISGVPAGRHELYVDGSKAGGDGGDEYAKFVFGVDVDAQGVAHVPPIYLPKIRKSDWMPIASPFEADTIITSPKVPGMEIHIPKGAVLRDREGKLVTRIALIPVPLDRMPFAFPENAPVYVSIQPAGMVVQGLAPGVTKGVRTIYPNMTNEPAGSAADFWRYDAVSKGWHVYGRGAVSADRRQIVPDPTLALYDSVGFMYTLPPPPPTSSGNASGPANAPPVGGGMCGMDGDPVDLSTGLFLHYVQHAALKDVLPVSVHSTYRPRDTVSRAFGYGFTHNYATYLREVPGTATPYQQFDLIQSSGAAVRYQRTSAGSDYASVVAEPQNVPPCDLTGSVLAYKNGQYMVTRTDGSTMEFSLYGRLEGLHDRFGNGIAVTSAGGQLTRLTTQNGRFVDFTYDSANRIKSMTDFSGRQWGYLYDAAGMLSKVTFPDGSTESYTYDTNRNMLTVTDRRGQTMVTNVYDADGYVTQQTLADGGVFRFAYTKDANGRVVQTDVTDPRGNVRRVTFHSTGLPLTDTRAFGTALARTLTYERPNADGQLAASIDSLGRRTEYTYDAKGNVLSTTRLAGTPQATVVRGSYEPVFNRLVSATDELGRTTTLSYDAKGNLLQVQKPMGQTYAYTYNKAGQPLTATDPLGRVHHYAYEYGDRVSVTGPSGQTSFYYTDTLGRTTAVTNSGGQRTSVEYDAMDRAISSTDANLAVTQFGYDGNGNLTSVTDPKGNVTRKTYDSVNRLQKYITPLLAEQTRQYDAFGNQVGFTHFDGQVSSASYDELNRTRQLTFSDNSSITFNYDAADRMISLVDSVNGTITRTYDDFDRMTSETTAQGSVSYAYDAAGRRTSMTPSGQATVNYDYDDLGRLLRVRQGASTVSFTYDPSDRVVSLTLPNGITSSYTYDDASRIVSIVYTRADASVLGDLTYGYDDAGQRNTVGGSLAPMVSASAAATGVYDAFNRLTSWNGTPISYDVNGNMLNDGSTSYTWNARNQLVAVTGAKVSGYEYDALGRRVRKTVDGVSTSYLYDGINAVQEIQGGVASAQLLVGLGVDQIYRRSDAMGARDLLTDALGSVIGLTDETGTLKTSYLYEPHGATTLLGEPSANPYQFAARENDGNGLYYYRARYYRPDMARFISSDPIGLAGGLNNYAYVNGDPISLVDPSGLAAKGNDTPTFHPIAGSTGDGSTPYNQIPGHPATPGIPKSCGEQNAGSVGGVIGGILGGGGKFPGCSVCVGGGGGQVTIGIGSDGRPNRGEGCWFEKGFKYCVKCDADWSCAITVEMPFGGGSPTSSPPLPPDPDKIQFPTGPAYGPGSTPIPLPLGPIRICGSQGCKEY